LKKTKEKINEKGRKIRKVEKKSNFEKKNKKKRKNEKLAKKKRERIIVNYYCNSQ
jgi:hypothetical protein